VCACECGISSPDASVVLVKLFKESLCVVVGDWKGIQSIKNVAAAFWNQSILEQLVG